MVTTLGAAFAAAAVAVVAVSGFWMTTFCAAAVLAGHGRRVVEERDHPGSGAAADQRAGDQAGDAEPQPAGPPRRLRRPPARAWRPGSRRSRGRWAGPVACGGAHGYCCPANRSVGPRPAA